MTQHDFDSRTPSLADETPEGTENGRAVVDSTNRTDAPRPLSTAGTWIIEVDDDRWRALVELLLPPGESERPAKMT